ncbi:aminotransferase/cystathione beta-lyase [Polynucleobacter meluiroseus]|uniref:cysteine-S-conjugate beta-lyase n=1 Tax=Polynucleobacter meluiroseus TaxID=1938814 RepID=A0A240DZM8_9BURK|nr:PatB family C-S lyase [Polynucleobacter meluiroseus]SNX28080.1 aminotransferase/cystathione beta-lyase [Polynucleobacter meluiroseus]
MAFDFDKPQNRYQTDSVRWDKYEEDKVLPLWVADMDFASPPCILEALQERVQHGIFGYTHSPNQLNEIIANYLFQQYQWRVDPDWIVILPSVVSGLYTAVQQLTSANESVVIPQPIYHHFKLACTEAGREYRELPLELLENRWVYPNNLVQAIKTQAGKYPPKLALFCNPQNPGSTVFTEAELKHFAQYCLDNNLWICSDEIHAGLILDEDQRHIPIASLSSEVSQRTVTLMSLNKTFNYPGIGLAWAVSENPFLRKAMQVGLHQTIPEPGIFAYTATVAAIEHGEPWRQALLDYLRINRNCLLAAIESIPSLSISKLEASYLAWIDCTHLKSPNPHQLFLDAGLACSLGSQFGNDQFIRLNFGTQRTRLVQALEILQKASTT